MKTKFILETSTLEDVLMKKYLDMKKQDSKACNVCEQTPCQCKKSDEKELAEGHFNHSIDDAFKMLDDLMRQERDLDIEPMLKRLSPELQKQLVQWAQTDGKAAVANDEYPEADWATEINKYLHGVAEDQDDECPVHGSYGFPNLQADESACTCDFDKLANPSWPDLEVDEGSFDPQHYFDANKDSKVRRKAEVNQSQNEPQNYGRDPLDDITHLAFKAGKKVKGMFKKQSKLDELGANNPPQGTAPAPTPTANTAANTAVNTSTLNPQEQKQLDDLLKKAGVVK
jgi:hypothetical protein